MRHRQVLERILDRCGALVDCNDEYQQQIRGYVVAEIADDVPVLHMVYVRSGYREKGRASALVRSIVKGLGRIPLSHTHRFRVEMVKPGAWKKLAAAWRLRFNPYLI